MAVFLHTEYKSPPPPLMSQSVIARYLVMEHLYVLWLTCCTLSAVSQNEPHNERNYGGSRPLPWCRVFIWMVNVAWYLFSAQCNLGLLQGWIGNGVLLSSCWPKYWQWVCVCLSVYLCGYHVHSSGINSVYSKARTIKCTCSLRSSSCCPVHNLAQDAASWLQSDLRIYLTRFVHAKLNQTTPIRATQHSPFLPFPITLQ